jgi:hypothetical protein
MNLSGFFQRTVIITQRGREMQCSNLQDALRSIGAEAEAFDAQDPSSLVLPSPSPMMADQLSEYLAVYNIMRRAHIDQVPRLLILRDNVKINDKSASNISAIINQVPHSWDLLFFAHQARLFKVIEDSLDPENNKFVFPVWWAAGTSALGINYPFYHLFLEKAKIPTCDLDATIKSVSLAANIFIVNPPLFYL